ncbi:MAG TPA: M4 family metallopeptidase [Saprospiraceae bacterium]|nr:M4 family metallopeptidase [Saprospiraceae bacterium]
MRIYITLLAFFGFVTWAQTQSSFKNLPNSPYVEPKPIQISKKIISYQDPGRIAKPILQHQGQSVLSLNKDIASYRVLPSGSIWIEMKQNELWGSRNSTGEVIQNVLSKSKSNSLSPEWKIMSENSDALQQTHIRVQQTLAGFPIKGQDMVLHVKNNELVSLNGFAWTAKFPGQLPEITSKEQAVVATKEYLISRNVRFQEYAALNGLHLPSDDISLIWFPKNGKLILAYRMEMHPNALDHWIVYIDASHLTTLEGYSETCSIAPKELFHHGITKSIHSNETDVSDVSVELPVLDGATVITDQDLAGQNRTVNGYQVGSNIFMIDASRTSMFLPAQSVMPNDPVGVIWTVDAQNSSPQQTNFEIVQVSNTTNNWKNLEVSAHFNAGQAFEYYRTTFNRNAINGTGGNIISIINVTDENDNNMDNAFWNGAAMFYGNGDVGFTALAKALDVGGHEMSHGVIGSTANLEYLGQSGALNESYADVFGAMIDRDDWRMGEDIVKLNFFPSGALRDLSDPHNGGSGPNDNGWQPAHMNEFQNLTEEEDNGGVHVNSGIPNKAFFLFATAIGKNKALTDYLVKSSQFIDMRIAVEKAATDLFGAGSTEVAAGKTAFDQVGIGAGQGGDYEDDIDTNGGEDFILATDKNETDLYFVPPSAPDQFVKMEVPSPISRPSFTDDGSACVYVDNENNMILLLFNWAAGFSYEVSNIESNPQGIWRNVVVSKDGTKIAFTTSNLTNEIHVYDYGTDSENTFELYNPTTAGGVNAGGVLYSDAMEWDYSGEFIMYDALNQIESSFGDGIEYWDIAFINVWNRSADQFNDGLIGKLYSALPENISIGNPSFSKNSPFIITFDFLEEYFDNFGTLQTDYWVIAANIEDGVANNIFHNNTVGYPSYSRLDNKILFTNIDDTGTPVLGTINVQPGDKTLPVAGSEVLLISAAQKGVWFVVGNRDFTATKDVDPSLKLKLHPQPVSDILQIETDDTVELKQFTISELNGRKVMEGDLKTGHQIAVDGLANGMYLLQLTNADGRVASLKFVKQ